MNQQNIGVLIKKLRKERNLTLRELAENIGVSISFLSQVERSKSSVTLESLRKISDALGVSPGYFFKDRNGDQSPVRKRKFEHVTSSGQLFIYEDLTGNLDHPVFSPILVTLKPGESKGNAFSHSGQEFLYVLEGKLTVHLADKVYELEPHDSIHFDSSTPHYWLNFTNDDIKFICVSSDSPILRAK